MRLRTHRQKDTQMRVTTIHFASYTTHAKCNNHNNVSVHPGSISLFPGTEVASTERTAVCRKPDELRLLKMNSTSGSTAAASTSSAKSCPSSTGSCGTACTTVDGSSSSSGRVPRRVFSTRGRGLAGAPAAGERGGTGPVSRAKLKTVKLTAAVVLSYFICWSPFFISHLWSVWDNEAPYEGTTAPRHSWLSLGVLGVNYDFAWVELFLPVSYQVDVRTAKFLQKYKATENRICVLFEHEVDRQLRTLCTIYKLPSGSSASKIIKQIRKNFFSSL